MIFALQKDYRDFALSVGEVIVEVYFDKIPECNGYTDRKTSLLCLYQSLHSLLCYCGVKMTISFLAEKQQNNDNGYGHQQPVGELVAQVDWLIPRV